MADEQTPDDPMVHDYHAFTEGVGRTLDVAGGLAAALDVADYRRARDRAAGTLDVEAGLQAALGTMDESSIDVRILGLTALRVQGELSTTWGKPRERGLLAVLLLHIGRTVPTETLVRWVWPDDGPLPRNVPVTTHTYMARLRKALRDAGASYRIRAWSGGYRLDGDRSTVDYHRFTALRREAQTLLRNGEPHRAVEKARQAVGLWQDRPLADLHSDWADNWRRGVVASEWLPSNITLLEGLLELGDHSEVLSRLDVLQPNHPHDVDLMKLRMSALHGLRRYNDVTTYYLRTRRQLRADGNDRAAEYMRQFHDNTMRDRGASVHMTRLVPRQLPSDMKFIGRESLLTAIEAAAQAAGPSPRVIALGGAAGIGKTTLAVHWAHSARHRFPGGDIFVSLNRFADRPDSTVAAVVDDLLIALGQPPDPTLTQQAKKSLLSRLLENRRILLVLDDVQATFHVQELVDLLTDGLIIVTTRSHVTTLPDEFGPYRITVGPMTDEEATDLLAARLGDDRRRHENDVENLARLGQGLPLLVTVLAEYILSRPAPVSLTTNLRIIANDTTPVQADVLFTLSYQALPISERRMFRLLGLHPGPEFSLSTARAYGGTTTPHTRRSLTALVDAHLLDRSDTVDRYRFHDVIHAFAGRRAARDEQSDVREATEQRGIDHYVTAATQAYRWLQSDHAVAQGIQTAYTVEPVVFTNATQARSWFDQERGNLVESVRAAAARGYHTHAVRLAAIVTALLDRHGYHESSRAVYEVALASARTLTDRKAEAAAQVGLGTVLLALRDYPRAHRSLTAGLRYVEDHGDPRGQAALLRQLGSLEMRRDDPAGAVHWYRQALDVVGDIESLCWTHCALGESHRILGDHDKAFVHLHQALSFAAQIGDESARAATLFELGSVHRDLGDPHRAVEHCEQALIVLDTAPAPDLAVTTRIHIALAGFYLDLDDLGAAMRSARRTIELARQTFDIAAEARGHDLLGSVLAESRDPLGAVAAWRTAAELFERTGMTKLVATIRERIAVTPIDPVEPDPLTTGVSGQGCDALS